VYSGFPDAHLNDPANFFGVKTNKMFILTQVGNHDALHYGNLVTYLRINGLEPSGGWFWRPSGAPTVPICWWHGEKARPENSVFRKF
jgi:hypothetical protein